MHVVTDETFADEVLRSPTPVLVDFWAEWCPPCRPMAATLESLAPSFAGRVIFAKLNADENPATTRDHRVMSMPTLILFESGRPTMTIVGARPAAQLRAALTNALDPYVNR